MNIEELRIGNWVQTNGINRQIHYLGMRAFFELEGEGEKDITFKYEKIQPIPLDETWLKKMLKLTEWFLKLEYNPVAECYNVYVRGTMIFVRRIYYVHQLQNLYHSLTNEELTIKDKVLS